MKYIENFRKHFSSKPVFFIRDVKIFLSKQKISRAYVHVLLNHLQKNGEINRVGRGIYTFKTDPNVLSFAFVPSYHGLQDALSIHGFWEQETNPVLLTPRKVRSGARKILGSTVLIRRIKRIMFFGFEFVKYFDFWIPVSDIEKTLIDFAYFNEPLNHSTLKEIKTRLDKKKLSQYLKKIPKKTAKKVLGML